MTATTTVANVAFESTEVQQVIGFWDEPSQKLTFVRVISQSDPSVNQINAGFRFDNERTTWLTAHTLTGYFEAFQGSGAVSSRVLYGWVASITVVG